MNNTIQDLIVIIPTYEPPKEFIAYAESVAKLAKQVVVVNDGSGAEYDEIFDTISQIGNIVYLKYGENHGKGFALKTGFKHCMANYSPTDIVVTADCDGQHKLEDIIKVYKATKSHPNAFVLGSRDMNQKNVPKKSKMGNQQIKNMFRLFYGLKLYDSQTGLRGCSVKLLEQFAYVKGDRFDYEHAQLIYATRNNIEVLETPIQTIYPENLEDHVSHFRSFKDSINVFGVMVKNLGAYFISSTLSAILDVVIFYLLARVILDGTSAVNTLIATVSARVGSSLLNFILNYKYVFHGISKKSIYRYYILWFCQLGASYGLVFLFGNVIGFNLTITKIIGDLFLAIISYSIQQNWVFKKKNNRKFYGPFANFALKMGRKFSKEYRCNVLPYDEPVVYVCRHLDMHGPYTTLKWLKFDVHPMVLSCFFNKKDCYNQYINYTFTARQNKSKPKFSFKAFFASGPVSTTVNSLKAVPVHRTPCETRKTFRKAMEYLNEQESLIVYPDIEYTADANHQSDIYTGFLYLGQLYHKKTGKELKFIPIYINEEDKTINECESIVINDYRAEKNAVSQYIQREINRS